ncbi:MAG: RES family NAD+ phosphorylase [Advenella sp.]
MIWQACNGLEQIRSIDGKLYRLVESQEQIATLGYVDTLEEQALLEQMLDQAKPVSQPDCETLHYLLKTPFRYPPLKWGSRFGRVHERSLFYGGKNIGAVLAESAFYRFVFWHSMDGTPVKDRIRSEHTLFSVRYGTEKGIQLQEPPFDQYQAELTDPVNYQAAQQIGSAMRAANVEAFEYCSARDPEQGLCVALFSPMAFRQKKPQETNQWFGEVSADQVSFTQLRSGKVMTYGIGFFLVNGVLPMPA